MSKKITGDILFSKQFRSVYYNGDSESQAADTTINFHDDNTISTTNSIEAIDLKSLKQIVAMLESKAGKILYGKTQI